MFARSIKKSTKPLSSSHISDDVADLINEIEHLGATAAPFDESIVVTKDPADDTALLVDNTAATDKQEEGASAARDDVINERGDNNASPDLSMQVSELSTDELAFLHESMKDDDDVKESPTEIVPDAAKIEATLPTLDASREDVDAMKDEPAASAPALQQEETKAPSQEQIHDSTTIPKEEDKETNPAGKSFMGKLWTSISNAKKIHDVEDTKPDAVPTTTVVESPQDELGAAASPVVKDDEKEKSDAPSTNAEDEQFNPFVNIGNRLLDHDAEEADAPPQDDDDDSYQQIMSTIGKVLQGTMWALGVCVHWLLVVMRMMSKITIWLLGICAKNVKMSCCVLLVLATGMYLKSALAPFSVTISVQPQVSAWNASMMHDLTPPPETVEEIVFAADTVETTPLEQSALDDWIALLKVLAVSLTVGLTGFSILGMQTSSSNNNSNQVSTYCKHEDDCSRYANLNIKKLKCALRSRNLPTTGNHSHLVDRLVAHDNGGTLAISSEQGFDIDVSVVGRNTTIKILQSKLRSRGLPVTGLKEDLIAKAWVPARVEELKLNKMDELRELLETNKLSQHGKSKDELIRRLIEAGH